MHEKTRFMDDLFGKLIIYEKSIFLGTILYIRVSPLAKNRDQAFSKGLSVFRENTK